MSTCSAKSLAGPNSSNGMLLSMAGLLSKLGAARPASVIAYLHDQERQGLQKFVGHVPWDHEPLLETPGRVRSARTSARLTP
ncbi:MAG: hypothetical protein U0790_22845 [Isosphaeraceae bacterium]